MQAGAEALGIAALVSELEQSRGLAPPGSVFTCFT
jgi:hypothetical protein